jgi:ribosomal-protein-alanine N-acetyltransferase
LCRNVNRWLLDMLETERLILRKMIPEDADQLLLIFSDPKVMQSFGGTLFDRAMMERWIVRNLKHQDRYGYGIFSVILKEKDELVGDCGLERMEVDGSQEVELGYDFRSDYWNRGLATEAAAAVRDYAFEQLGIERLISLIRPGNLASQRVAEKIGMNKKKECEQHNQRYYVYSLSRSAESGHKQ